MKDTGEYIRCKDDILYFAQEYLKIDLHGYQIDMLQKHTGLATGQTANIIGFRTCNLNKITIIYVLWATLFHDNAKICIISPFRPMSENMFANIYSHITLLDKIWRSDQEKPEVDKIGKNFISFDNESSITLVNGYENTVRGRRFDTIIYESLFSKPITRELFSSTLSSAKKYIITNCGLTPQMDSMEEYGDVYRYPWYCDPTLTLEWHLQTLNSLGKTIFELQYGCTRGFSKWQILI